MADAVFAAILAASEVTQVGGAVFAGVSLSSEAAGAARAAKDEKQDAVFSARVSLAVGSSSA